MDNQTGYKLPLITPEHLEALAQTKWSILQEDMTPKEIAEAERDFCQVEYDKLSDVNNRMIKYLGDRLAQADKNFLDVLDERNKLKTLVGQQADTFLKDLADKTRQIETLSAEVKAGAYMLADMHDKAQSVSQAVKGERERIMGIIAASSYSKPDSLDLVLPFETWQELCRMDGHILKENK